MIHLINSTNLFRHLLQSCIKNIKYASNVSIARILTDQAYNEIYSSASYAGRDSIYDPVLTVTGGSNKWCFPWLTSADGGATEESLRRQRTVNPRNCGSPCASRDPGPEYWKLHLTLPYTHCRPPFANQPSPRYLRASPRCVYNRPQSFLDASRYYTICSLSRHRCCPLSPASGVLSAIRTPSEAHSYTLSGLKSTRENCDLLRFYYRRVYILILVTRSTE